MRVPLFKRISRHLRGRWRDRTLAAHGLAIVAQTKNGLLAVQPGDFNVSRELLEHGEYDWAVVQWLRFLLAPRARLVVAGAHIGSVLVPLALGCPDCEVLAFEPSPRNFRLLKMNLSLNGLAAVQAHNVALGEVPGQTRFTENRINTGNSRVSRDSGELQVDVETLDRTVPAAWPRIDLLVMDVEGYEVAVMRGARQVLSRTHYLLAEFAPEQLREQGSGAAEFLELAAQHFRSAYVFAHPVRFLGPGQFGPHLLGLQHQHGLLLNVLFTQDETPDPALAGIPA